MKILKKCNYPLLFDVLYKIVGSQDIEEIYSGMKSNVIHYGLNPFHTEYGYLDSEYYPIHMFSHGSTQKLTRSLFPLHLIKERIVRKNTNFNLTDITGDERLLALLSPKNSDYYALSDFYKDFTYFDLTQKDFVNFHGGENGEYEYSDAEISNIFFLHILHRNKKKTYCNFDFLLVFKYVKEYSIGQSFENTFYNYLLENDADIF